MSVLLGLLPRLDLLFPEQILKTKQPFFPRLAMLMFRVRKRIFNNFNFQNQLSLMEGKISFRW